MRVYVSKQEAENDAAVDQSHNTQCLEYLGLPNSTLTQGEGFKLQQNQKILRANFRNNECWSSWTSAPIIGVLDWESKTFLTSRGALYNIIKSHWSNR